MRQKEDLLILTHGSLTLKFPCLILYRGRQYTVRVSYEQIFNILVFLIAAYVAGLVTKAMGMPALVGEIITGFLVSLMPNVHFHCSYFH